MDSQREGERAGATVLSLGVMDGVLLGGEFGRGPCLYCCADLSSDGQFGIQGCYFVSFTLISTKEKEGEIHAVSKG